MRGKFLFNNATYGLQNKSALFMWPLKNSKNPIYIRNLIVYYITFTFKIFLSAVVSWSYVDLRKFWWICGPYIKCASISNSSAMLRLKTMPKLDYVLQKS